MLANHPNLPHPNPNATVRCVSDFFSLDSGVTQIIVDENVSDLGLTELNLTRFSRLKRLEIGDHCFNYVNVVRIVGLSALESVVIGENSFTLHKNGHSNDPNHRFYLKNCPKLKAVKTGRYSFSDYSVIEIESVDALEAIAMGDLNEWSYCFYHASLELKSVLIHSK
mgnify:CR=1 FL=1